MAKYTIFLQKSLPFENKDSDKISTAKTFSDFIKLFRNKVHFTKYQIVFDKYQFISTWLCWVHWGLVCIKDYETSCACPSGRLIVSNLIVIIWEWIHPWPLVLIIIHQSGIIRPVTKSWVTLLTCQNLVSLKTAVSTNQLVTRNDINYLNCPMAWQRWSFLILILMLNKVQSNREHPVQPVMLTWTKKMHLQLMVSSSRMLTDFSSI